MSKLARNPWTSWLPTPGANFASRPILSIGTFAGTVEEGEFYIRGDFASGMELYPYFFLS